MPAPELCAIEFPFQKLYRAFVKSNPAYASSTTLQAGPNFLILFMMPDFPTRDILESFDFHGSQTAKFIGPDALKLIYQIELPS